MHRSLLLRTALVTLPVLGLVVTTDASATPSDAGVRAARVARLEQAYTSHAGAPASKRPTADPAVLRLAAAAKQRSNTVLAVRGADDAAVAGVRTYARTHGLTVRHVFGQFHTVTVRVPRKGLVGIAQGLRAVPGVSAVQESALRLPSGVPNDPQYAQQSSYLDAVHAADAWDHEHGASTVRVAVVDTGVDLAHPDLAGKVDASYNAVDGTSDVSDAVGHGTFVAGVVGAATNNAVGIAGAGYDTHLLAVKVADADGVISADDDAAGIVWAVDHGARVVNVSLAGTAPSEVESQAVAYAQTNGALVVAAVANDGLDEVSYPAAYPEVLGVGATDADGGRAPFSDYGSSVDLAAPGVDLVSTTPTAGSTTFPGTSGYSTASGTSYAAALVSGAAALLKAHDPSIGVAALRTVLIGSASGYAGLGLGAGQVDFADALTAVPPTTTPTQITASGTSGVITFHASSSAASVRFAVGGGPVSAPMTTTGGIASYSRATWGITNAQHSISAYDCTSAGVCSTQPFTTQFLVENDAPVITAPRAGASITGGFRIDVDAPGGGVRFLIDGTVRGFDSTRPYSFAYTGSALSQGRHTLLARLCSASQTECSGPLSTPVSFTSNSLHPTITSVTPVDFSPDGDGYKDTTTIAYHLPDTEQVTFAVYNYKNVRVRNVPLGTQSGSHSVTWRGYNDQGTHVLNGTFTARIETSKVVAGVTVRGLVGRSVRVDTVAPTMSSTIGGGTSFYPVADGYRDNFVPSTVINEYATVSLQVKNGSGTVVRTLTATPRSASRVSITWRGYNDSGHLVPAGTYHWSFTVRDPAGNVRHGGTYTVYVSLRHLVSKSVVLRHNADSAYSVGATDACADAYDSTLYAHGIELINTCGSYGEYYDIVAGFYKFTLPTAVSYDRLYVRVAGNVFYAPARIYAGFLRSDSDGVDVPSFTTMRTAGDYEYPLAQAAAAHHVGADHSTRIAIALDGYAGDVCDFEMEWVQLTASYRVLS